MSLAAGELNRKIVIAQRNATKDAANQPVDVWLPVFPDGLWAKSYSPTGMATVYHSQAGVAIAPGKCSWRIRYRPNGITTAMRVEYKDVIYLIREIRHDLDRHEYTDLVCEGIVNNG